MPSLHPLGPVPTRESGLTGISGSNLNARVMAGPIRPAYHGSLVQSVVSSYPDINRPSFYPEQQNHQMVPSTRENYHVTPRHSPRSPSKNLAVLSLPPGVLHGQENYTNTNNQHHIISNRPSIEQGPGLACSRIEGAPRKQSTILRHLHDIENKQKRVADHNTRRDIGSIGLGDRLDVSPHIRSTAPYLPTHLPNPGPQLAIGGRTTTGPSGSGISAPPPSAFLQPHDPPVQGAPPGGISPPQRIPPGGISPPHRPQPGGTPGSPRGTPSGTSPPQAAVPGGISPPQRSPSGGVSPPQRVPPIGMPPLPSELIEPIEQNGQNTSPSLVHSGLSPLIEPLFPQKTPDTSGSRPSPMAGTPQASLPFETYEDLQQQATFSPSKRVVVKSVTPTPSPTISHPSHTISHPSHTISHPSQSVAEEARHGIDKIRNIVENVERTSEVTQEKSQSSLRTSTHEITKKAYKKSVEEIRYIKQNIDSLLEELMSSEFTVNSILEDPERWNNFRSRALDLLEEVIAKKNAVYVRIEMGEDLIEANPAGESSKFVRRLREDSVNLEQMENSIEGLLETIQQMENARYIETGKIFSAQQTDRSYVNGVHESVALIQKITQDGRSDLEKNQLEARTPTQFDTPRSVPSARLSERTLSSGSIDLRQTPQDSPVQRYDRNAPYREGTGLGSESASPSSPSRYRVKRQSDEEFHQSPQHTPSKRVHRKSSNKMDLMLTGELHDQTPSQRGGRKSGKQGEAMGSSNFSPSSRIHRKPHQQTVLTHSPDVSPSSRYHRKPGTLMEAGHFVQAPDGTPSSRYHRKPGVLESGQLTQAPDTTPSSRYHLQHETFESGHFVQAPDATPSSRYHRKPDTPIDSTRFVHSPEPSPSYRYHLQHETFESGHFVQAPDATPSSRYHRKPDTFESGHFVQAPDATPSSRYHRKPDTPIDSTRFVHSPEQSPSARYHKVESSDFLQSPDQPGSSRYKSPDTVPLQSNDQRTPRSGRQIHPRDRSPREFVDDHMISDVPEFGTPRTIDQSLSFHLSSSTGSPLVNRMVEYDDVSEEVHPPRRQSHNKMPKSEVGSIAKPYIDQRIEHLEEWESTPVSATKRISANKLKHLNPTGTRVSVHTSGFGLSHTEDNVPSRPRTPVSKRSSEPITPSSPEPGTLAELYYSGCAALYETCDSIGCDLSPPKDHYLKEYSGFTTPVTAPYTPSDGRHDRSSRQLDEERRQEHEYRIYREQVEEEERQQLYRRQKLEEKRESEYRAYQEQQRIEEERRMFQEQQRIEEERRSFQERQRLEEERRSFQERQRLEDSRQEEEYRIYREQQRIEEERRREEERRIMEQKAIEEDLVMERLQDIGLEYGIDVSGMNPKTENYEEIEYEFRKFITRNAIKSPERNVSESGRSPSRHNISRESSVRRTTAGRSRSSSPKKMAQERKARSSTPTPLTSPGMYSLPPNRTSPREPGFTLQNVPGSGREHRSSPRLQSVSPSKNSERRHRRGAQVEDISPLPCPCPETDLITQCCNPNSPYPRPGQSPLQGFHEQQEAVQRQNRQNSVRYEDHVIFYSPENSECIYDKKIPSRGRSPPHDHNTTSPVRHLHSPNKISEGLLSSSPLKSEIRPYSSPPRKRSTSHSPPSILKGNGYPNQSTITSYATEFQESIIEEKAVFSTPPSQRISPQRGMRSSQNNTSPQRSISVRSEIRQDSQIRYPSESERDDDYHRIRRRSKGKKEIINEDRGKHKGLYQRSRSNSHSPQKKNIITPETSKMLREWSSKLVGLLEKEKAYSKSLEEHERQLAAYDIQRSPSPSLGAAGYPPSSSRNKISPIRKIRALKGTNCEFIDTVRSVSREGSPNAVIAPPHYDAVRSPDLDFAHSLYNPPVFPQLRETLITERPTYPDTMIPPGFRGSGAPPPRTGPIYHDLDDVNRPSFGTIAHPRFPTDEVEYYDAEQVYGVPRGKDQLFQAEPTRLSKKQFDGPIAQETERKKHLGRNRKQDPSPRPSDQFNISEGDFQGAYNNTSRDFSNPPVSDAYQDNLRGYRPSITTGSRTPGKIVTRSYEPPEKSPNVASRKEPPSQNHLPFPENPLKLNRGRSPSRTLLEAAVQSHSSSDQAKTLSPFVSPPVKKPAPILNFSVLEAENHTSMEFPHLSSQAPFPTLGVESLNFEKKKFNFSVDGAESYQQGSKPDDGALYNPFPYPKQNQPIINLNDSPLIRRGSSITFDSYESDPQGPYKFTAGGTRKRSLTPTRGKNNNPVKMENMSFANSYIRKMHEAEHYTAAPDSDSDSNLAGKGILNWDDHNITRNDSLWTKGKAREKEIMKYPEKVRNGLYFDKGDISSGFEQSYSAQNGHYKFSKF